MVERLAHLPTSSSLFVPGHGSGRDQEETCREIKGRALEILGGIGRIHRPSDMTLAFGPGYF